MIFVTVGAQMPFDRLIQALDTWVSQTGRYDFFAQIGPSAYEPTHMEWTRFIEPCNFRRLVEKADAVVGHAGTGTILTALEIGKPILVMPRRSELRETRNDHQVGTSRRFEEMGRVIVAYDESDLILKLEQLSHFKPGKLISRHASPELLHRLRSFVDSV